MVSKDYAANRAWYLAREASPAGVKKRVERDQARTIEIKAGKLRAKGDPRTVDHLTPLSKGGGNAKSNLGIKSVTANRRKYNN